MTCAVKNTPCCWWVWYHDFLRVTTHTHTQQQKPNQTKNQQSLQTKQPNNPDTQHKKEEAGKTQKMMVLYKYGE